tara:strand:- start:3767 stop:4600 length:834 start_codon:yes stop_codon:yes gene_type:complete
VGCGLVFSNPQPSEHDISNFYTNHYRQYYQKQDKPSLEYIQAYKKDKRAYSTVEYLACHGVIDASSRILDIGASEGEILHRIKKQTGAVALFAVEPNPEFGAFAVTHAGCLHFLDMAALPVNQKYDLVILNHVFEHLSCPVDYLSVIRELLAENGHIYIDVPDVSEYRSLESLHIAHMSHFSLTTLRNTLAEAGFEVVDIERHVPVMHPRSVRGLFRLASIPVVRAAHDWSSDWQHVRRLQRQASRYHRKRWSLVKRALNYLLSYRPLERFSVAEDR